ncbi:hypothetical protein Enr13x_22260 [Stieleria neptunia]|uniref:Uncharacterized protein n=1 Tax=Stieleria neptunia TaxID=2527979 RepID=A0A518HNG5_9BACT|nr:hypothetical protein Enr13x_22260 [Stieleria neptunia]
MMFVQRMSSCDSLCQTMLTMIRTMTSRVGDVIALPC